MNPSFLNRTCNEFSGAFFQVPQYMIGRRFNKILGAIPYSKKDTPPPYNNCFWDVQELNQALNDNISVIFLPQLVSCLNESMLSWTTNKHTCPSHMCVPRKPWPFDSKYHSICCCFSGLIYSFELVEGDDHLKEVA